MESGDLQDLISRIQAGDERATAEVYQLYATRLMALARSRISPKLAQRLDPEDVVQSAYRSFFLGARDNAFVLTDAEDLWQLLASIVLNKLRRQAKRHRAAKRTIHREVAQQTEADASSAIELSDREPSIVDLTIAAEELAWLLRRLETNQQTAIHLRLQSESIESIAASLSVNERTVRRWLTMAHELLIERDKDFTEPAQRSLASPVISAESLRARGLAVVSPRDYILERLIGSGGVSKVYVARHRNQPGRYCIKVLRKRLRARPSLCEWFLNEASLVARLSHPKIVPIHSVGLLSDGGLFLVMRLIEGHNLSERIARGGLSLQQAIAIVREVAACVEHAHRNGVLHCDLKPENVLIDQEEKVWLTDFGFGRLLEQGDLKGEGSVVAGTIGYMAPEQLDPAVGSIGTWTDVYGLAALLRTLIAGKSPSEVVDGRTSTRLEQLVSQSLQQSPSERISMSILIGQLDEIMQQTPRNRSIHLEDQF